MSLLIIVILIALIIIVLTQVGKTGENLAIIDGLEKASRKTNKIISWLLVLFFLLGLVGIWKCNEYFSDKMLPIAACKTGQSYDSMFMLTVIVTGIVFFLTQAILFWFV